MGADMNFFNPETRSFNFAQIFPFDFRGSRARNLKKDSLGGFILGKNPGGAVSRGCLLSRILVSPFPFDEIIVSPSVRLAKNSRAELRIAVSGDGKKWTKWYKLGEFSPDGLSKSFPRQEDENGFVDVDFLKLKKGFSFARYKIILESRGGKVRLKSVNTVFTDSRLPYLSKFAAKAGKTAGIFLKVPPLSQMEPQTEQRASGSSSAGRYAARPEISRKTCAPASLAMIFAFHKKRIPAAKVAAGVYDEAAKIYGNWLFNTMFASRLGFHAHVRRLNSMEELESLLLKGTPVIASLAFGREKLKNSPLEKTSGHLLVVKGIDENGDVTVNDPAARSKSEVERIYKRKEFAKSWLKNKSGTCFVIMGKLPFPAVIGPEKCEVFLRPSAKSNMETEALHGEKVVILSIKDGWAKIRLPWQEIAGNSRRPRPYAGWTRTENLASENVSGADMTAKAKLARARGNPLIKKLSMGSRLSFAGKKGKYVKAVSPSGESLLLKAKDVSLKNRRRKAAGIHIVKTARLFVGDEYVWGGRSGSGVDCSGLVSLVFGIFGIDLPRNADDQFRVSKPADPAGLRPGDLVFSGKSKNSIDHVMIYSGKGRIIEATGETMKVREISFKKKFGFGLFEAQSDRQAGKIKIYFRKAF